MEWYWALVLMLGTVCLIMFLGVPVAFAFFAANILGTYLFLGGDIGLVTMPLEFHLAVSKYSLTPIALFLLMGEILLHTGVAFKAIGAIDRHDRPGARASVGRFHRRRDGVFLAVGLDHRQHGDPRQRAVARHDASAATSQRSPWGRSWPLAALRC